MVKKLSTDPQVVSMAKCLESFGGLDGHQCCEVLGNTIGVVLADLVKKGMYRDSAEELAGDIVRMAIKSMEDNL